MMTKKEMMDTMINLYGFEHPIVIQFCEMVENEAFPDSCLEALVKAHQEDPQYDFE